MLRKRSYIFLGIGTTLVVAFLYSKGAITGRFDFYKLTNGQVYRYFIYVMLYVVNYAFLSYDTFNDYVYLRVENQMFKKAIINFGLPFYINVFATIFGVLYFLLVHGVNISVIEFVVTIVITVMYQLFVCLIFINMYIRSRSLVKAAGLTFGLIWILNDIVFIRIVLFDDLVVLLALPILMIFVKRGLKR